MTAILVGCGSYKPEPPKRIAIDHSIYSTIENNLTVMNYDYYGNVLGISNLIGYRADRKTKKKKSKIFTSRVDYMWAKKCSGPKLMHMKEFYRNQENLKEWRKFYNLLKHNKDDEYKAGILKIRNESCEGK